MSNRHQRRAARRRAPDLLVDHFEAGTSLHGRPHAGLKTKTVKYWSDGSYSPASWHQCFVCGWPFQSPARSAGAFLIAVQASDPHPTEAAIAPSATCAGAPSPLPEIEAAATTFLHAVCPGGSFQSTGA